MEHPQSMAILISIKRRGFVSTQRRKQRGRQSSDHNELLIHVKPQINFNCITLSERRQNQKTIGDIIMFIQ